LARSRLQLSQQPLIFSLRHTVESRCKQLQGIAIDDGNATPRMADPSACIERVERRVYARSPGTEHQRQKLVRKMDLYVVAALMSHQQPARQAFLDRSLRIGQGRVRNGDATNVGITKQRIMKRPAGP